MDSQLEEWQKAVEHHTKTVCVYTPQLIGSVTLIIIRKTKLVFYIS